MKKYSGVKNLDLIIDKHVKTLNGILNSSGKTGLIEVYEGWRMSGQVDLQPLERGEDILSISEKLAMLMVQEQYRNNKENVPVNTTKLEQMIHDKIPYILSYQARPPVLFPEHNTQQQALVNRARAQAEQGGSGKKRKSKKRKSKKRRKSKKSKRKTRRNKR